MAQAYKVDFTTRTITITAEFEKAMSNPEAAEYKIIRQLCADFPGMRIVKRTTAHRRTTPARTAKRAPVIPIRT